MWKLYGIVYSTVTLKYYLKDIQYHCQVKSLRVISRYTKTESFHYKIYSYKSRIIYILSSNIYGLFDYIVVVIRYTYNKVK